MISPIKNILSQRSQTTKFALIALLHAFMHDGLSQRVLKNSLSGRSAEARKMLKSKSVKKQLTV